MARAPRSRIVIGGRELRHKGLKISQQMPGDLPDAVPGTGGVPQRTASVEVSVGRAIQSVSASPFNRLGGEIPAHGARVGTWIDAGDGTGEQSMGEFLVDGTSGRAGEVTPVELVDDIDRLRRTVWVSGLMEKMPPDYDGGPWMAPLPTARWVLSNVLQQCGFHTVPAPGPGCILDVPMQGAIWPRVAGTVSRLESSQGMRPSWVWESWGDGVQDLVATFGLSAGAPYTPGQPLTVSMIVGEKHAATSWVRVVFAGGKKIELQATASRSIGLWVDGVLATTLSAGQMTGAKVVSARVTTSGCELRNEAGATATAGNALPIDSIARVDVEAGVGASIAAIQLNAGAGHPALLWRQTARITNGRIFNPLFAVPNIRGRVAREVIDEICKATLSAFWIDREGVARVVPSEDLAAQWPVKTVSTRDGVRGLKWLSASRAARRTVNVTYATWSWEQSPVTSVELWQGEGKTLQPGSTRSVFIEVPADELWLGLDHRFLRADAALSAANRDVVTYGLSSVYGVAVDGPDDKLVADETAATISVAYLGNLKWLYSVTAHKQCVEQIPEIGYLPRVQRQNLPILRARSWAKIDGTETVTRTGGPDTAPSLEHDMGPWGGAYHANALADFLASRLFAPAPIFEAFDVRLDPSLEVGQVIEVQADGVFGVRFWALLLEVSHDVDARTTTLTGRLTKLVTNRTTWSELDEAFGTTTWSAADKTWAQAHTDYSALDADPLKGA